MLKKTDYSRGSMKRNKGEKKEGESPFGERIPLKNPSGVYQSKTGGNTSPSNVRIKYQSPSPTLKHQIAPGLVIEGEEADL
jgi:hypothetical protein